MMYVIAYRVPYDYDDVLSDLYRAASCACGSWPPSIAVAYVSFAMLSMSTSPKLPQSLHPWAPIPKSHPTQSTTILVAATFHHPVKKPKQTPTEHHTPHDYIIMTHGIDTHVSRTACHIIRQTLQDLVRQHNDNTPGTS